MHPRIVLRTHYQANEPRTIIAGVTDCSSPTESRQEDAIAASLVRWAKDNGHALSLPGAVYSVGNARTFGLLNSSYRWSATGLAFGYIRGALPFAKGAAGLVLNQPEERLFFRCYLEHGGALLVKFGRWLLERGYTTDDELRRESVIERLVVEVLDEYLLLASDVRDRTAIRRERDRLKRSRYVSSTQRHKRYPLVTAMERLHLLGAQREDGLRVSLSPDPVGRLAATLDALPDIATLERVCRGDRLGGILLSVLGRYASDERTTRKAGGLIADAYRFAIGRGLQACPLAYLDDLLFAWNLIDATAVRVRGAAEAIVEPLHRQYPGDIRFHVDRQGRRAFLLISGAREKELETLLGVSALSH